MMLMIASSRSGASFSRFGCGFRRAASSLAGGGGSGAPVPVPPGPLPWYAYSGPPLAVSFSSAVEVAETVLFYVDKGIPGKHLDNIRTIGEKEDKPLVERWRCTVEVYMQTQLDVATKFGFAPDLQGLQGFAEAMAGNIVQSINSPDGQERMKELQEVQAQTWEKLVVRAFGDGAYTQLSSDAVKASSAEIAAAAQKKEFLDSVERLYHDELRGMTDPIAQHDALQTHMVPCYMAAVEAVEGIAGDEGYVALQANIHQNMTDPQVANNIGAALMAVRSKCPI